MRSFAFAVTMLIACAGKSTPVQQPRQDCESGGCVKAADCENGGCGMKAAKPDCGSNGCDEKSAKQDCGSNGCEQSQRVYAGTCESPPCDNELTRKFSAPNPCGGDPKPCDNDPNCGGAQAAKRCESPPCD